MLALDEKSQSTKMTKTSVQIGQLNGVEVKENRRERRNYWQWFDVFGWSPGLGSAWSRYC